MPDKIVSLRKVVGEVSETTFLDPPNTQYGSCAMIRLPSASYLLLYLLLAIKISAWPTKTLKPPQPRVTLSCNFVNRAHGHPGGAGYRQGWVADASMW